MLPVNVAFIVPVHTLILHYDIVQHDSTTAMTVHQTLPCNLAALPLPVSWALPGIFAHQATT